jgi:katanin p60 ATPase-containing subunit A1
MDGCSQDTEKTVLVLAATNFPWDLDEALRRRLEKRIYIPLPDREARVNLLQIALQEVKLHEDVDMELLASQLEGYSGADITNICREAAMMPLRECIKNKQRTVAGFEMSDLTKSELDLSIRLEHFQTAIKKTSPSVSQSNLQQYKEWIDKFGAE